MDTTATDTRPTFSRLTERKTRHSWRAAVPVVVVLVAIVALVAYLASRLSTYSQRADFAERDANQYRDQVAAITKQVGDLQKDVTLGRSAGRTTVILEAAQPAKGQGKKNAATPEGGWAAAGPGATRRAGARDSDPAGEERRGNAADAPARQVSDPPCRQGRHPTHATHCFGRGFRRGQPRSILDRTGAPPYALALFQAR